MSLSSGQKLAHYEIIEPIGKGGMGEVYRARDGKLGRDVAIKVLAEELSKDRERLSRFEREAKLLASLNHPAIATLYGFEDDFLVMELVEGETLAEWIARGPIPLEEALPLFIQITEGIEAAHEKGIVHRDLKPANIKITPDGQIKILDFGLAKALLPEKSVSAETSQSPTLTKNTALGTIMGTASYMSPEQARGKTVDKRTDIWAFGCCLFEALAGKKAFEGETVTDIIAAVVNKEPSWERLPVATPSWARALLRRCLQKESRRRLHHIADARIELEELRSAPADELEPAPSPGSRWRQRTSFAIGALGIAAAAWTLLTQTFGAPVDRHPPTRFAIPLPELPELPLGGPSLALSRDGRTLVYTIRQGGDWQLYRREMDRFEATPIPSTEGAAMPFLSPDGEWLGFYADGALKKVPLAGGEPLTLCRVNARGASWSDDDSVGIVFGARGSGLERVSAAGGTPEPVTTVRTDDGEIEHLWPHVLPGSKAVLYTVRYGSRASQIAIQPLDGGEPRLLVEGGHPRYSTTGHIVFGRDDAILWAAPFDVERLLLTASANPVIEGVDDYRQAFAEYALAADGSLAYIPWNLLGRRMLVWVDRDGNETAFFEHTGRIRGPALSPDGTWIAASMLDPGENENIWLYDIERGTRSRLTSEGQNEGSVWKPDGTEIAFNSNRRGGVFDAYSKLIVGNGEARQWGSGDRYHRYPTSWSPDGGFLAFSEDRLDAHFDIGLLLDDGEPTSFLATPFNERGAQISPSGRFIAYVSDETGRDEIYVRPVRDPGRATQISLEGGEEPLWSRDGRELFYRNGNAMMSVSVETAASFTAGTPVQLFERRYDSYILSIRPNYGVSADGQTFLMIRSGQESVPRIHVVVDWGQELERLVTTDH